VALTKQQAHSILFHDALHSMKAENLSVYEWEERIESEPDLREASLLAGPVVISAITCFVWRWDRFS